MKKIELGLGLFVIIIVTIITVIINVTVKYNDSKVFYHVCNRLRRQGNRGGGTQKKLKGNLLQHEMQILRQKRSWRISF